MNGPQQSNRHRARSHRRIAGFGAVATALLLSAGASDNAVANNAYVDARFDPIVWELEEAYDEDFNGDGYIGRPPSDPDDDDDELRA